MSQVYILTLFKDHRKRKHNCAHTHTHTHRFPLQSPVLSTEIIKKNLHPSSKVLNVLKLYYHRQCVRVLLCPRQSVQACVCACMRLLLSWCSGDESGMPLGWAHIPCTQQRALSCQREPIADHGRALCCGRLDRDRAYRPPRQPPTIQQ